MPLETGSLVTLYRRTNPGVGMIIEKIDDIFSVSKNGQKDLEKLIRNWNNGNNLKTRNYAISNFIEESEIEDNLVISFLQSNGFYRYSQGNPKKNICKIKKTFVKIFWFSNPSDYNIKIIRRNIDWFPMEWLKAPKKPKKIT
tara:strand:+ start:1552 stop:1977 length:426 start_codon:yes stop_codon:yes gene_type:complete